VKIEQQAKRAAFVATRALPQGSLGALGISHIKECPLKPRSSQIHASPSPLHRSQ
jgi:hypothetical protein